MESYLSFSSDELYKNKLFTNSENMRNDKLKLSSEDEHRLKKCLVKIHWYYIRLKEDPEGYESNIKLDHFLELNYLNNFLSRSNLIEIEGFKKQKIIPILLDLSTSEYKDIRGLSLSILANITYCFEEIINELVQYQFYDSININLQFPVDEFPEKRHVFRWIYNFLCVHEDLAQELFEKVSIKFILESSIDCLSNINYVFCSKMFLRILLLKNITFEQVKICVPFFKYFLENQKKGLSYILLGLHKLLSKPDKYPIEFLCTVVNDLEIENIIPQYIQNEKINRKKCFSFCILADLFELGFKENSYLVPFLLQTIGNENENLADWFLRCSLKSVYKILKYSSPEIISLIYQYADVFLNISTIDTYFCISLLFNKVSNNELLTFISDNYIELIVSIIFTDDPELINLIVNGFIRIVEVAEIYNETDRLSQILAEYDGVSKFNECLEDNQIIEPELIDRLHQVLKLL